MNCRTALLLLATISLASCGIFGGDDDELKPTELTKLQNTVDVQKLWSAKLGDDAEFLRVALRPSGDVDRIFAASVDGNVSAFNSANGKEIWRTKLKMNLSAGPGYGENLVAVVGADGELVALDAATGKELWRSFVGSESLAQPIIKENLVVVFTIDNRLQAVSAFDGVKRWEIEQSVPLLTMRGSASPVVVGPRVIAGFDNGRLAAVNLSSGDVEWETLLSPPTGRSDLERLADIDGNLAVVGQDVYAAGYNGQVAAVASESGQLLWAREVSSYEGVAADWSNVYTVSADGELVAIARRTGTEAWRQNSLLRREPTLPVAFSTMIATGDFEGYVHFFDNLDGKAVARVKTGGAAITSDPVVIADRLFVQSDAGTLTAFAIRQPKTPKSPRKAPDVAAEGS